MRRPLTLFLLLTVFSSALVVLAGAPSEARTRADLALQLTLPGTNTPAPTAFSFATNTPNGPTDTPTPSATATFTATNTATATATATDTPSPTPTPNGPVSYPDNVNPLTGKPYLSDAAMARRNLLVKVSNFPPLVRPQSGLNLADLVFEYEVEGGVTRFAAIFRDHAPTHVGPVRSGRLVDLQLVPMYAALFAYSGSSDPIRKMILDVPWGHRVFTPQFGDNCNEAGFCRFPEVGKAFEHTLYLDTNALWARADKRGVNDGHKAKGFAFNPVPDPDGKPSIDIDISWYGKIEARWQYDPATGHYLRFTDGLPHMDKNDGQQLWADNIVIIQVPHVERPDLFEPESKSASQDIQLYGTGSAYVFRDGVYYQGLWVRRNEDDGTALQLVYGNNVNIMMKPGRTYVEIVRGLGQVDIEQTLADMPATSTMIAASWTPTPLESATPSPTVSYSSYNGETRYETPTAPPGSQ